MDTRMFFLFFATHFACCNCSCMVAIDILQEATELGKKARELKKAADALHQEERSGSKGRKWRKNVKAVEKVYVKS